MPSSRLPFAFVALVVLAFEAIIVWRPFDVRAIVFTTPFDANLPAGELVDGFRVTQEITARRLGRYRPPRGRSIQWKGPHSIRTLHKPNCFALHFATYKRSNAGHIQVSWQQGSTAESWVIPARDLVDNAFVDFCPRGGFAAYKTSVVTVQGMGGKPGDSATLWLTRSKLRPASVQGRNVGNHSLSVEMSYLRRATASDIAAVGKGAFLLACLCSLAIALLALWRGLREIAGLDAPPPIGDA
jgi:hypothetical protein